MRKNSISTMSKCETWTSLQLLFRIYLPVLGKLNSRYIEFGRSGVVIPAGCRRAVA